MASKTTTLKKDIVEINLETTFKKVTCSKCSRRRDLYFVGMEIYCVDDAFRHLVSLTK